MTKVVLAFELGMIPPNINLKTLRSDIEAFHNGKISVSAEVAVGMDLCANLHDPYIIGRL